MTNLDLHDIARAARTYGIRAFYVITPLEDQLVLVRRIVDHWLTGAGAAYNPARRQALEIIRIRASWAEVMADVQRETGQPPRVAVTSARGGEKALGFGQFREMLKDEMPCLLCFGTAWGLSPEFIADADYMLEPVQGAGDYNHLSVRSAAAIIMDRLLGR